MLNEIKNVSQAPGEYRRRWFFDKDMDLTVWFDPGGAIVGFQIVYDRPMDPHAMTWWRDSGFYHHRVDDGERPDKFARKGTPILLPDGCFDPCALGAAFEALSKDIDPAVAAFVRDTLSDYPG
ncbi:MAG: hypothetical protein ABIL58_15535 [Pseudomonadota bacterium]